MDQSGLTLRASYMFPLALKLVKFLPLNVQPASVLEDKSQASIIETFLWLKLLKWTGWNRNKMNNNWDLPSVDLHHQEDPEYVDCDQDQPWHGQGPGHQDAAAGGQQGGQGGH